jgi:hypothetical protein
MSSSELSRASRHDEPPLIEQESQPINNQLTRKGLLAVHEVADQDKEYDKDIQVKGRR